MKKRKSMTRDYRGHTIEILLPTSKIQCSQWTVYDYEGGRWDGGTLCWDKRHILDWCKSLIDRKLDHEKELLLKEILDIEIG